MNAPAHRPGNRSGAATPQPVRAPVIPSEALMAGHKTVDIVHNGTVYRLQATRLGKLILTK